MLLLSYVGTRICGLDYIITFPSLDLKSWLQLFCLLFVRGFCGDRVCCCSVAQSCPTLCNPMDYSTRGFPVLHSLPEFAQTHVHWISDVIQPYHPRHPLLFLLSIFPSITIISNELALCLRSPKHWTFSPSPSNEYSVLISFTIDWFDLLAFQGTLKSLLQHHNSKTSILWHQSSLWSNSHISTWLLDNT